MLQNSIEYWLGFPTFHSIYIRDEFFGFRVKTADKIFRFESKNRIFICGRVGIFGSYRL